MPETPAEDYPDSPDEVTGQDDDRDDIFPDGEVDLDSVELDDGELVLDDNDDMEAS